MKKSPVANVMMATLMLIVTNGCSFFAPKTQSISINSEPEAAEVVIDNTEHFTTPCDVTVSRNDNVSIIVRKDGYRTKTVKLNRTLSTTGVLDVVGACIFLVPALGLLSPGAYKMDQNSVYVPLVKDSD